MGKNLPAEMPETRIDAPWLRRYPLRAPTLPPATHTNAYLLGEGTLLLVDPGTPQVDENERLLDVIARLDQAGHRVAAIFLTHHHYDHVAGATYLSEHLAVPVWAHRETALRLKPRGLVVAREIDEGEALPFSHDGASFVALHTPGHAPGHLCLLDQAGGGLIVGDMVASVGSIFINPLDDGDMASYLASLERLLGMAGSEEGQGSGPVGTSIRPLRLWPAHGASIEDGANRLRFYLAHRREREERVLEALRHGAASVSRLVERVYADTKDADPQLAAVTLLAHLRKLECEGRAGVDAHGTWELVRGY